VGNYPCGGRLRLIVACRATVAHFFLLASQIMPWKNVAYVALMGLLGAAGVAYTRARRAWLRRVHQAVAAAPSVEARREFLASEEHARLRRAMGRPVFFATLVVLALFLLERFG
jgi:hypothetical protein